MAIRTRERALELAAHRKAIGRVGGRPKGSLSPKTIQRIKDKQTFEEEARKRAGRVLNNLLLGSDSLDTQASKEILERAFGKAPQEFKGDFTFSLAGLSAQRAEIIDGNKDTILLPAAEALLAP